MKKLKLTALIILGLIILIQLIPVDKTNPKITYQVNWDSRVTESLFHRACADCHSNETKWPWYSHIAPVSFIIAGDISEGREKFNISNGQLDKSRKAAEELEKGEMPISSYLHFHPEARLTDVEKKALIEGLIRTFGLEED